MIVSALRFFGRFWASCSRIWMNIGGNQADAFPDLPSHPKTLDFHKKIPTSKKSTFENDCRHMFSPENVLISLILYRSPFTCALNVLKPLKVPGLRSNL